MMSIFQIRRLALGAIVGVGLINMLAFPAFAQSAEPLSSQKIETLIQNLTGAGKTVVDSNGKLVGLLLSSGSADNFVELQIDKQWVVFGIGTAGLDSSNGGPVLHFTDQYCNSQPYVEAEETPPRGFLLAFNTPVNYTSAGFSGAAGRTYVSSGTLVYPSASASLQIITAVAARHNITSLSPLIGPCDRFPEPHTALTVLVGRMATVNLGPFTPPLRVK